MNSVVSRTWSAVLFDLDGTILDSAPGIIDALTDTFAHLGLPVPSREEFMAYIGPPLLASFQERAGMTEVQAREALTIYRKDYRRDGAFDSAIFPGILGLLDSLRDAGVPLALATSKPEDQARAILAHFDLTSYFTVIAGASEDDSRTSKAHVVGHALDELQQAGADISRSVLIGDRIYDVEGAAAHNLPTIIVEWGYGSPAEAVGAIATVYSADRLRELLLG
ncbi:HAD hydrolase-like protein [Aurantimicrobium sp. MWH-Uga1]|uniref:HAD hydrolase-like protein n=1 Tax=Aurantimicrobium sp. MWH-Uga1 TaxID=2079575 RepID=UPI000DEDEA90|nr:HAD hydrolase-like protein [Aurantimicrobium sp. MWH-Uga1]AXE53748.1 5'-nucleotidase [Aurantimicrobium sp. MWH-Uga1]